METVLSEMPENVHRKLGVIVLRIDAHAQHNIAGLAAGSAGPGA